MYIYCNVADCLCAYTVDVLVCVHICQYKAEVRTWKLSLTEKVAAEETAILALPNVTEFFDHLNMNI